jgi:hypothetical protein
MFPQNVNKLHTLWKPQAQQDPECFPQRYIYPASLTTELESVMFEILSWLISIQERSVPENCCSICSHKGLKHQLWESSHNSIQQNNHQSLLTLLHESLSYVNVGIGLYRLDCISSWGFSNVWLYFAVVIFRVNNLSRSRSLLLVTSQHGYSWYWAPWGPMIIYVFFNN